MKVLCYSASNTVMWSMWWRLIATQDCPCVLLSYSDIRTIPLHLFLLGPGLQVHRLHGLPAKRENNVDSQLVVSCHIAMQGDLHGVLEISSVKAQNKKVLQNFVWLCYCRFEWWCRELATSNSGRCCWWWRHSVSCMYIDTLSFHTHSISNSHQSVCKLEYC